MGILGLGRKKKAAQEVAPEAQVVEERSGPALMLLVPEVAGGTSFRALPFNSTGEAAAYLSTLIPAAVPRIHAFWAMMGKPGEASIAGESMVLIRSEAGSELVYVVSFVDIESALSFARFEVKRGLDLGMLMVYWAELVSIEMDEEGIRLTPESAPVAGDLPIVPAAEIGGRSSEESSAPRILDSKSEVEAPVPAEAPALPPDREGGATTNWVRKAPPQAEQPTAAEPDPVTFEEPPTELVLGPNAMEDPAREFTLQPEVEAAAFTPEREAPQDFVAAEPEPVAFEESPVREFSLQPEVESIGRVPGPVEFPPEPGEVVAADDLLIEEPGAIGIEEIAEPEFGPEPEDYAAEVGGTEAVIAEELELAASDNVAPTEFAPEPEEALAVAEESQIEDPEPVTVEEVAAPEVVDGTAEPAPVDEMPIEAAEPMAMEELETVSLESTEAETASEANADEAETTGGPATPLWAEQTDAVAEEPADGVEQGSQETIVVAADAAEKGQEPDGFSFGDDEPLVADAPSFLREDASEDAAEWADEPVSPQSRYEPDADKVDDEPGIPSLSQRDGESGDERHEAIGEDVIEEPELVASEEPVAEKAWAARDAPVEETVVIGANGASSNGLHEAGTGDEEAPETIPGEEDLSPEMAAFLRSRRRATKDNPFRGFDSPPGRF